MSLYENGLGSNYEELKTYYPAWYRDVVEMDAIWHAGGDVLDDLEAAIDRVIDNNFLDTADEATISRLERHIPSAQISQKPIEDRRKLIKSYFMGFGKMSGTKIKRIVSVYTDSPCDVRFTDSTIYVTITRDIDDTFILSDCTAILLSRIPAHLPLVIIVVSPFESQLYIGSAVTEYTQEVLP